MLSELVVGYLFCGGAGAGACVLLAALGLLVPRGRVAVACVSATGRRAVAFRAPHAYRRLMAPAFCASFALLAFGIAFLVADLGVPGRALLVFAFPTPTFLTAGAFSLAALSLVAGSSSALFYGAVVAAGIALPLLLEGFSLAARKGAGPLALAASAAVLAGGLALRYCVVAAGAHPLAWAMVS